MHNIATAAGIRAIAFTPKVWNICCELAIPAITRRRALWLRIAIAGLIPAFAANAVVGFITAIRNRMLRPALYELRIS